MTNLITAEQCIGAIHADIAWRKKEILSLSVVVAGATESDRSPLIRAALVLLYAHWEGFVKSSASTYVMHINERVSRCGVKLNDHFQSLLMWRSIQDRGDFPHTKSPVGFLDALAAWKEEPASLLSDKMIDTESNLTSKVLLKVVRTVGVSDDAFRIKFKLIDEKIVGYRNEIAHGRRVQFSFQDYQDTDREVRELLEVFQVCIVDCVQNKAYLK